MRKIGFFIVGVILVVLIVGYLAANRDRGPDTDQISALIERGRQAIEHKALDTAMSCISKNYHDDNGLNYDQARMLTSNAFRANKKLYAAVDSPDIQISGEEALARTHVSIVTVNDKEIVPPVAFSGDVVLHLKKERIRRYLIFPARDWKVIKIDGISAAVQQAF